MNLTLLIVVIITAIALVSIALSWYLHGLSTGKKEKLTNVVFPHEAIPGCNLKPDIIYSPYYS